MTQVRGLDTPVTVWRQDNTLQANVSGVGGVSNAGTPECRVSFLAPSSGRVLLIYGGQARDSGGTDEAHIVAWIQEPDFTTPSGGQMNNRYSFAVSPPESQYICGSQMMVFGGLEPGREYVASARVGNIAGAGATIDFAVREVIVVPLP